MFYNHNMKKIFITGIAGFAGSHLAEYLLSQGDCEIVGTYITAGKTNNLTSILDKLTLIELDLNNREAVEKAIRDYKPDYIYHLAALASPAKSFADPSGTIMNNVVVELNILEALRKAGLVDTKILIIASGDMYGIVKAEELPLDENTPLRPISPYAVSKITQDYLGLQYALTHHIYVIRARPFNHIGPRQTDAFAVGAFAKKMISIEKGIIPPVLKVGNLDAKRDFTDVRDMVKAYVALMDKGIKGEAYNIGTGTSHQMSEILDMMKKEIKMDFTLETDQSLIRPNDIPEYRCNATKMMTLTGWKPQIPLNQTLRDILEYWRNIT